LDSDLPSGRSWVYAGASGSQAVPEKMKKDQAWATSYLVLFGRAHTVSIIGHAESFGTFGTFHETVRTNNRAHTQETYYCLPAGRFTSLGSKVIRLKEAPLHMNVPRVGESATRCLPNPDPVKHSASSIILSITSRPLFCLARLTMSRSNCARPVKDLTLEVITLCLSLAESQYVHTHELPLLHKVPCFLGTPNFRIVRGTPQRSLKVRVQYFSPANGRLSTGNTRQRHFEMSILRLQSCGIGIMLV